MIDRAATFFLGGHDLEMEEIACVLNEAGMAYLDRGLAWGARISDYKSEIAEAVMAGRHAFAVELEDDMPASWPSRRGLRIIDHHGGLAGEDRPTSLEQILGLLAVPPSPRSHWRQLVSANDKGHIAGLMAIGADASEIAEIRRADRRAQKITAEQEAKAVAAIARRRIDGRLTRVDVDLPSATAVTDFISPELGGPGADRLLVVMPHKLAVFAEGIVIRALARSVEGAWWGGMLPASGFWGAENKGGVLAAVSGILAATP